MNEQIVQFAALLCSHCTVTFDVAKEVAIDVLVDIEMPLATRSVTANALNVREQPGVDKNGNPVGKIVSSLTHGQEVEEWCNRDGWSFVVWDDNGGWCSSEYID